MFRLLESYDKTVIKRATMRLFYQTSYVYKMTKCRGCVQYVSHESVRPANPLDRPDPPLSERR